MKRNIYLKTIIRPALYTEEQDKKYREEDEEEAIRKLEKYQYLITIYDKKIAQHYISKFILKNVGIKNSKNSISAFLLEYGQFLSEKQSKVNANKFAQIPGLYEIDYNDLDLRNLIEDKLGDMEGKFNNRVDKIINQGIDYYEISDINDINFFRKYALFSYFRNPNCWHWKVDINNIDEILFTIYPFINKKELIKILSKKMCHTINKKKL